MLGMAVSELNTLDGGSESLGLAPVKLVLTDAILGSGLKPPALEISGA